MLNGENLVETDQIAHVAARMIEGHWTDRTTSMDEKTRSVALLFAAAADKWGATSQQILGYMREAMAAEILNAMEAEYRATQLESAPVV